MTFHDCLEAFTRSLSNEHDTKVKKRNRLIRFGNYIKSTECLPEDWNLDCARKVVIEGKEYYFPINKRLLLDFFSHLNKEVTPRVYNDFVNLLNEFFDALIDMGVLKENLAKSLVKKKIPQPDMDSYRLSLAQVITLLGEAARSESHLNRNYALILALSASTIRIGELLTCTEEDVYTEIGMGNFNGKTGNRVRVLVKALCESFESLIHDPYRIDALEHTDKRYLFYSSKGGKMTTREANRILKSLAKQSGITEKVSTYWLRRSFATIAADYGLTPLELARVFAHDDSRTIYRYLEKHRRKELVKTVNQSPVSIMLSNLIRETIVPIHK